MNEMEVFIRGVYQEEGDEFNTSEQIATLAFKYRNVFPLLRRAYGLALTAPVSVAKNERAFSRLKIVKNFLRSSTHDDRLNSLMLLYCESDITDQICVASVLDKWVNTRKRRTNFKNV